MVSKRDIDIARISTRRAVNNNVSDVVSSRSSPSTLPQANTLLQFRHTSCREPNNMERTLRVRLIINRVDN